MTSKIGDQAFTKQLEALYAQQNAEPKPKAAGDKPLTPSGEKVATLAPLKLTPSSPVERVLTPKHIKPPLTSSQSFSGRGASSFKFDIGAGAGAGAGAGQAFRSSMMGHDQLAKELAKLAVDADTPIMSQSGSPLPTPRVSIKASPGTPTATLTPCQTPTDQE